MIVCTEVGIYIQYRGSKFNRLQSTLIFEKFIRDKNDDNVRFWYNNLTCNHMH
jgi:hypothetical protein